MVVLGRTKEVTVLRVHNDRYSTVSNCLFSGARGLGEWCTVGVDEH